MRVRNHLLRQHAVLTLFCVLTVVFFTGGHTFWGVVFALITVDFAADAVLAFKRT